MKLPFIGSLSRDQASAGQHRPTSAEKENLQKEEAMEDDEEESPESDVGMLLWRRLVASYSNCFKGHFSTFWLIIHKRKTREKMCFFRG